MLYPKSKEKELDAVLFADPTAEYRGKPLWGWNTRVEKGELLRQIGELKEMGMGGFHIHPRTGLDIEYLGNEFFDCVKACSQKAKEEGMYLWLYDEDRWPSGYGGGKVTKNKKYRARHLVFTPFRQEDIKRKSFIADAKLVAHANGNGTLIAAYSIELEKGYLKSYRRIDNPEEADGDVWYAYVEIAEDTPWFNNEAYVNTLDKEAIVRFLEVTYEKYYEETGEEFGRSIPAIFTDEPQFEPKTCFPFAQTDKEAIFPYTDDLEKTFQETYKTSLLEHLPELFWELPEGKISKIRYWYHAHISTRFTEAFSETVGEWCRKHNIVLTGHVMMEPTLGTQTAALGEAMRSYKGFGLPGIDMLCDRREYTTAKQAQSVSHQYGREGVLSELYGVTNWDFDFRRHKLQGDWQAALGVTDRVHHLSQVTLEGEAKRDYPASIHYQVPWYKEYAYIESHFARINTALTRGICDIEIGVIHPIESYWIKFGPQDQTGGIRRQLDTGFLNFTEWMLFGLLDFDFLSESLMEEQDIEVKEGKVRIGHMQYSVIIVPDCFTLRRNTVTLLKKFKDNGGKVIFAGRIPHYIDAEESMEVEEFADGCIHVPFTKEDILGALELERKVDVRVKSIVCENHTLHEKTKYASEGERTNNLLYQLRKDGKNKWLFLCNGKEIDHEDTPLSQEVWIYIKGEYSVKVYDTLEGTISPAVCTYKEGKTIISRVLFPCDSLLLKLEPVRKEMDDTKKKTWNCTKKLKIPKKVPVTLSEPNVVVLDCAEYQLDDAKEWEENENILKIDNKLRTRLGYPLRRAAIAQPWTAQKEEQLLHTVKMRFLINADYEIENISLALENFESTRIFWNGQEVTEEAVGWFIDRKIKKCILGNIKKGKNELILEIPNGRKTNLENCYILGDFGVQVAGQEIRITKPVRELSFADWTYQGLPFYAGNVTYHIALPEPVHEILVCTTHFRNPLLKIETNRQEQKRCALPPYRTYFEKKEEPIKRIDITAYGNRINTLGCLHNCDYEMQWCGPDAWRSSGDRWSDEYQFKRMGLLRSPEVYI